MDDILKNANLDPATQRNVEIWLRGVDENTKAEIERLLKENPKEIVEAFYTRLTFGTGGLRGVMGIGTNRMNIYTVGMATQGLVNYLKMQPAPSEGHSVFIGYDSRHNSRAFAEETAKVVAGNGMRAFLCQELRPTPFVSFGCRFKGCSAAVMITASHNPPQYNGYKVSWNDGGQVVPPHDTGIIAQVRAIENFSQVKKIPSLPHENIIWVGKDVDTAYINAVSGYQLYPDVNRRRGSELKIAYTSLHGAGIALVPDTLKAWGFPNVVYVADQIIPNGDFPTAKSPNPEEKAALALGIETMKQQGADILLATDPDGDRVGIAVMHQGRPTLLNGNQVACLCVHHVCEALQSQGRFPKNAGFVKTIATTELFKKIVDSYGGTCFDVLTGFKYIAEKIRQWEQEPNGYQYIFGGEESYGYLLGTHARDKDAVISCALISETALQAKLSGKTLVDQLYTIYEKYGVYDERLGAIKFEESKKGRELMAQGIQKLQHRTPKEILGVKVTIFEDYINAVKTTLATGKKEPILLPKTPAFLFWLSDGTKLLIRPSGTEPKIKVYCGVVQQDFESVPEALAACDKKAADYIDALRALVQ